MNNFNNLSDDELDALFRQSAEERNIDFDEGAWQKMNNLLDQKQPLPKTSNFAKTASIAVLLLLLLSFGVFLGDQKTGFISDSKLFNDSKSEKVTQNTTEKTLNQSQKSPENLKEETISDTKITENQPDNSQNSQAEIPINSNKFTENTTSKTNKISRDNVSEESGLNKTETGTKSTKSFNLEESTNPSQVTIAPNKLKQNARKTNLNKPANDLVINNLPIENDEIRGNNNVQNITKRASEKSSNKSLNNETEIEKIEKIGKNNESKNQFSDNKKVVRATNDIANIEYQSKDFKNKRNQIANSSVAANTNDVEPEAKINNTENLAEIKNYLQNIALHNITPKTKYKYIKPTFVVDIHPLELPLPEAPVQEFYKKGLSVRLAISPDLSRVGTNKIDKIGSNFGAIIEYRLNKKFSIQTGIIRSMKYYDAYPDQYKWVWGYSHAKLNEINAKCKMLDFPLNIRYDMLSIAKTRIFANGGVTTYRMMKENYHYDYVDNTSTYIKVRDWEGKTGTFYASNLNISVGLEKYISKNLTLQVEPFIKSPLKSIGFGKVPIITYGTMFSVKYPLLNLKKK